MKRSKKSNAGRNPVMRTSKSHEATAAFLLLKDAARAVPGVTELTKRKARKKNGKMTRAIAPGEIYPDKFLEGLARAVQTVSGMKEATDVNPDVIREGIAFVAAYLPFADAAETLARNVRQLANEKRREMTKGAKVAFEWLKWKADATESSELLDIVEKLQKASGKGRKPGKPGTKASPAKGPDTTTPPKSGTPST